MNKYPLVSVIVPVLNREKEIAPCIESLVNLDYPSYEIIIVDNGSTDNTCQAVSAYPVKLVTCQQKGENVARNKGVKTAEGQIIAFTDSDCVVDKGWLKNLVRNYTDKSIGTVGGQTFPFTPHNLVEEFSYFTTTLDIRNFQEKCSIEKKSNQFYSGALANSNVSYRKDVFEELGGFDPSLLSCADFDLCWRVQRAGYKIILDPGAKVLHKHRSSLIGLVKQFFFYGSYRPLLLKKQPERLSYVRIKIPGISPYEFSRRLPILFLINLDCCNLLIFLLILSIFFPFLLYISGFIFLVAFVGTLVSILKVRKRIKWSIILFPLLYLIRNISFTCGQIRGGMKHKVVAI